MLHPSFIDNIIFALQQDGTERFLFMINEEQEQSFYPKSLNELNDYFENLEREKIEAEKQNKRMLLKQKREVRQAERKQQKEIQEKERMRLEEKSILAASSQYKWTKILCHMTALLISSTITYFISRVASDEEKAILCWFTMLPLSYAFFIIPLHVSIVSTTKEKIIKRYKNKV